MRLRRFHEQVLSIERLVCCLLLALIVALVVFQVVTRYAISNPPVWTEEAARFTAIWLVFIGAAYLTGEGALMKVALFDNRLSIKKLQVAETITEAITVITSAILLSGATDYISRVSNQESPALGVPMHYVYGAAVVGYVLIIAHVIIRNIIRWSGNEKAENVTNVEEGLY